MKNTFRSLRSRLCLISLALVSTSAFLSPTQAADIWFAPTDPVWRPIRNWPPNDFMDLFVTGAAWPKTSKDIKVFEITKRFANESSDDQLLTVINGLRVRGIKLAVQTTPLLWTERCGMGIEGHGPPGDMKAIAERVKRLGGLLSYATMDEPLWYGHNFDRDLKPDANPRTAACHSSIAEIASQAAQKIRELRSVFPNVIIGEDEPIGEGKIPSNEWLTQLSEWLEAYRHAAGEPLGYFHFDVVWLKPNWESNLQQFRQTLAAAHIPYGVIYNGTPRDADDEAWTHDAENHFEMIESKMGLSPAHAVFQSWMDRPRALLPEDKPSTFLNLVLKYATVRRVKPR